MNKFESSPPTKPIMNDDISEDEDENLTYEQRREKNIRENIDMLELFGINQAAQTLADSIKQSSVVVKNSTPYKRKIKPKTVATYTRRSLRLANIPVQEPSISKEDQLNFELRSLKPSVKNVDESSIPLPEEDSTFFNKLSADLTKYENSKDFNTSDFTNFTKDVKNLVMTEPPHKVVGKRIYSLAIHPSETSLVVAAGDQMGNISIFSKNDSDLRQYRVHNAPVNCISFCSWDRLKFFSTSHDGSVRCGDLSKRTFDVIYHSKLWAGNQVTKNTHCTWHTEYERNLLIANGSGRVDLIDSRTPNKINSSAQCHLESVRTVQCHPLENHYFLTASRLGEVSLWDVRSMTIQAIEPVLKFEHPKSLTSAFFSATGSKMVSTCYDDVIRIFNTSKLDTDSTKPVVEIDHNNHTGAWISVFKTKWYPGRDDAIFVGSLLVPKRIQIYRADGYLLHNLESKNMSTYCPIIEVHPTQNILVGGNGTGRLHIFNN